MSDDLFLELANIAVTASGADAITDQVWFNRQRQLGKSVPTIIGDYLARWATTCECDVCHDYYGIRHLKWNQSGQLCCPKHYDEH